MHGAFQEDLFKIGESDEEALTRKIKQDLAIDIAINNYISENSFAEYNEKFNIITYDADLEYGNIKLDKEDYRWVEKKDLNKFNFTPVDNLIINSLKD